jgi:hypothetical protein
MTVILFATLAAWDKTENQKKNIFFGVSSLNSPEP